MALQARSNPEPVPLDEIDMDRVHRIRFCIAAVAIMVVGGGATPAAHAAGPVCPGAAKVSSAIGVKAAAGASSSDACEYGVEGNTLQFVFTATTNAQSDMAKRRADAVRRTAPVVTMKAGKYDAFTGTAEGQARLFFNPGKFVVYVAHVEISARSDGLLKALAKSLPTYAFPKVLKDCAKLTVTVKKAVPDASFDSASNGICNYKLKDGSTIFIGTDTETSYRDTLDTFKVLTTRPKIADVTVNGKTGFAFQTSGTTVVLNLGDRIAEINYNVKLTPLATSLPVKAAGTLS